MNTGGPAFPAQHFDLTDAEHGMTLRDYFAAKAMQGCVAGAQNNVVINPQRVAEWSYEVADAMLKEREK